MQSRPTFPSTLEEYESQVNSMAMRRFNIGYNDIFSFALDEAELRQAFDSKIPVGKLLDRVRDEGEWNECSDPYEL